MWTSVADLFTPTSLFLFLNLTIAAIAITSRKNKHPAAAPLFESDHHHHHHNEHHLPRAPSLLERVRSLNFNFSSSSDSETESTNNTPTHHFDGSRHHFFSHGHDGGGSSLPTTPTARALDRASSLFKSLPFSPLRRPDPEPVTPEATRAEDDHHDHRHNFFANNDGSISSPPTTPTARALERASSLFKSHGFSLLRRSTGPDQETVPEPRAEEVHHVDHRQFADDGPSPPTTPTARALERATSLFKSHGFSLLRRSSGPDPETVPEPRAEEDHHVDHRHFFADEGPSPPTTPTARALERASSLFKSHGFSLLCRSSGPDPETVPEPRAEDHRHFFADDVVVDGPSPPTTPTARMLERASSLFKSHRFSPLLRSGGPDPEPVGDHHRDGDHDNLVKRSKSESEVPEAAGAAAGRINTTRRGAGGVARMMKSASEKCAAEVAAAAVVENEEEERRRPATVRLQKAVSIGDDGEVDSKADDFINRFKQQLKLQRIDSLLRNRELLRAQQQQLHS